jgi:hypothetical protein
VLIIGRFAEVSQQGHACEHPLPHASVFPLMVVGRSFDRLRLHLRVRPTVSDMPVFGLRFIAITTDNGVGILYHILQKCSAESVHLIMTCYIGHEIPAFRYRVWLAQPHACNVMLE